MCDDISFYLLFAHATCSQPAQRQAYQSAGSERAFSPVERELVFDVVRYLGFSRGIGPGFF